ncbi:uncharacterized protein Gasu_30920 [Galdieria sulphuraria]|uniref:Uncharacterized protein n=1 Tax=Galdieria sulphuraria TaxID=130081 RepID=M2Y0V8_GALSU|nr:uncharacterized protein Gasu_30920 [Galdieria sulphuraria]EME29449.1 hypothetical protein Gasu_30920 [Galdieria sulphuraria]|eukprot:XP_005705969.1 hypothetical protein Gasu_30920 [Galdieria sulphuraria]
MWKRVTGEESIRFNRSWREASFDVTSLYRLSALSQHWCCTSSRVTTRDDNASRVDSFNLSKSKFLKPKVVFKTAAEILHSVTEAHGKSAAQFADDLFDESKALMADSGNADALRKRLDAAVDAGHLTAMKMLGSLFLSSTFSEDYSQLRGENLLEAAAAGGETDALYEIAVQLRSGAVFGIAPGLDRIHRLLLKAADQGHEQAQFFLGILYITGELNGGVPCYEKAEHFLKASASSGLGLAQFILGIFVLRGWSPTTEMILQSKDAKRIEALRKQAIKLIESAASKNHKNAMLWLKALYDQERLQKKQNSSAEKLTTEKPVDSG